jgi:hypothetical protein
MKAAAVPLPSREADPRARATDGSAQRRRRWRPADQNVPVTNSLDARRRGSSSGRTLSYRAGTVPLRGASHLAAPDLLMFRMLSELDTLIEQMARRCRTKADGMTADEAKRFHALVKKLDDGLTAAASHAGGSSSPLHASFIELGGLTTLQRAFAIPLNRTEGDELPDNVENALTLSLNVLTDICTAEPRRTAGLSRSRGFMRNLFNFMRHPELLEWSLGLLLAAGDELFPLSSVDNLAGLIDSLSPKGLALFCRALAGIFSKQDEPAAGLEGLPPPEWSASRQTSARCA